MRQRELSKSQYRGRSSKTKVKVLGDAQNYWVTHRPLSSSFLGLPYRIPKSEP